MLKANFNAFASLSNRTDLGNVLIEKYNNMAAKDISQESLFFKGEHSVKLSFLELMIGQEYVNSTLTRHESKIFIKSLIDIYARKRTNREIYGMMSLSTSAWSLNKLLILDNANNSLIIKGSFVEKGNVFTQELADKNIVNAKTYMND
jgi:hypothetical protein